MIAALIQEKSFLLRRPWVFLSWVLLTGLVVLAMREGRTVLESRQSAIESYTQEVWNTFEERRANAAEVEAGTLEVSNTRQALGAGYVRGINVPATAPVSALQAWSPGLWDAHPTVGTVGVLTSPSNFLSVAAPRDAEAEGWGRLDLTTVVVILLPLWLLLVFHDTGSHERDRGLFRILEGNGVSRRRIVARRSLAPIGIGLVGWSTAFGIGALLTGTAAGTGAAGWAWFAISLGYAIFWMGCFAWVAALARSTETAVTGSLVAWVAIVILLPGLMDIMIRATSDPAAGIESVASQRVSAAEAEKQRAEVMDKYMFDHPELAQGADEGAFASTFLREYFATQESVEEKLQPVVDRHFEESAEQLEFVGTLSSVVPSSWAQGLLEEVSGTGPRQMLAYHRAARSYAKDVREFLRPFLWEGNLLTPTDFDRVPRFASDAKSTTESFDILRWLWLPALGLFGLVMAWRRWMRTSVVSTVR